MRKKIVFLILILSSYVTFAQISLNLTGDPPHSSAAWDIQFSDKGILIPRVSLSQANLATPVSSPETSLLIYNTATSGVAPNNVTPGYYYWNGSRWVRLLGDDKGWMTDGNSGTNPSSNFLGTTDNVGLSFRTNNLDRLRLHETGQLVLSDNSSNIAAEANYLFTIRLTTNTYRNGIRIPMSGATSIAHAIFVTTGNSDSRGYFYQNTSGSNGVFFGAGALLSETNIVSGFLGYRNSSGLSYGLYGINGTNSAYATNANTWAAFIQGRAVISSESSPTSPLGVDLEIRNTTTGSGNPATLSMRQTTSETTIGRTLARLNFGDNHTTDPQAQISVTREAAGGASDFPTAIIFLNTADGTNVLTERMRISNNGNVGIGTNAPTAQLHTTGTVRFQNYSSGAHGAILRTNNSGELAITNFTGNANQVLDGNGNFVNLSNAIPAGVIVMWSGTIATIPSGWALCDGNNGTPDLRDRFILCVSSAAENPGAIGGTHSQTLAIANLPPHSHDMNHTHGISDPGHQHGLRGNNTTSGDGNTFETDNNSNNQPRWTDIAYTGITVNHHWGNTGATGSGHPFDNRPAYYKLAFIMKLP